MTQFLQDNIDIHILAIIDQDVYEELQRACKLYPLFPQDPIHAANIIVEEAGEVAKDVHDWTYEPVKKKNAATTRVELIQTMAMCIRMIAGIDSGQIKLETGV
jgi:hypothetical protein